MARICIIGAGAMGLAAGYHAAKAGHDVTIYEAAPEIGGMAAHFDFDGLSIERFYHFFCYSDHAAFELFDELGIGDQMRWMPTSMGYLYNGRLYKWGDPISLFRFPGLSLIEKFRYGLMMFVATKRKSPGDLENRTSKDWIEKWCGKRAYEDLWRPLFDLKFFEFSDRISAAWIWTRFKRMGTSRRSIFQEEYGYLSGGSQMLIDVLERQILELRGKIHTSAAVTRINTEAQRVCGVTVNGEGQAFDAVISTIPTPFVSRLVPDLPEGVRAQYDAIPNIGVICAIFRLKRSVSPNFWLNIVDANIRVPGIIEFSNLRATEDTVVYVPYYMPTTHPTFQRDDVAIAEEAFGFLKRINPDLEDQDRIAWRVSRLKYAQPICTPGFLSALPPVQTAIEGLQIADTCFYYPEDRGISESVRLGKEMALAVKT